MWDNSFDNRAMRSSVDSVTAVAPSYAESRRGASPSRFTQRETRANREPHKAQTQERKKKQQVSKKT